jgi:hypothetical protein
LKITSAAKTKPILSEISDCGFGISPARLALLAYRAGIADLGFRIADFEIKKSSSQ